MPPEPPRRDRRNFFILLIGAGLFEAAYLSLYLQPSSPAWLYGKYIATALACFGLYAGLSVFVTNVRATRRIEVLLWVAAIVFRVSVTALPPFTSDDLYRYVWDGRVQQAGINPYAYPPNDPALAALRDDRIHPLINHPDLPTIYPPLAEWTFRLAYLLGGNSPWGIKLLLLVADLATMWLLRRLLQKEAVDAVWLVAYAWCPLPVLELFVNGHVDGFGLPFLVAFYLFVGGRNTVAAAAALGGAVLVKLVPAILAPWALRWMCGRERMVFLTVLGGLCLAGYAAFLGGADPFHSLGLYVRHWEFNAPVYHLVKTVVGGRDAARIACGLATLVWIGWVAMREPDAFRAAPRAWIGFFLFSATVHPWYLLWLAPLLVVRRSPATVWWMAAAQLSYVVWIGRMEAGTWIESRLVWTIEYVPLLVLFAFEYRKKPRA